MRDALPSPASDVLHLGPVPLRAYALLVIVGIVVAVAIGDRRLRARGYPAGVVVDIAMWAVPFGLVGARLWHVATDNQLYFRAGRDWTRVFAVWDGGLGIWGALLLGGVGAAIGARQLHVRVTHLADALAVALPVGQAIGRVGNYLNQELYGRPSTLPWAIHIDPGRRISPYFGVASYQPTFAYALLWDLAVAGLVVVAARRGWFGRLAAGRAFALSLAAYAVGQAWIGDLRIDPSPHLLGLRLDVDTAVVVLVLALGYLLRVRATDADELLPARAGEAGGLRRARPTVLMPVLAGDRVSMVTMMHRVHGDPDEPPATVRRIGGDSPLDALRRAGGRR